MSEVLGIDIGQGSLKLALINKDSSGVLYLENVGESKISLVAEDSNDKTKYLEEVKKSLKSLLGDQKIKLKQVVASLPESEVVSRLVRLPPLKDSEIMDALKFEAETFVPYPLDEVSIDYEIIEKDDAGRLSVFVIAARNDLIQMYVKLFKSLGLELLALESPSVSYRRVVKNGIKTVERVVVLDLGEKYTDIFNINKGNAYFARSVPIGGESLTRSISLGLGLDLASAEEYKKAYGIKENELEGKIRAAVLPVFNSITDEVRKAMTLFTEDSAGHPVELLVLSGGGANLPGMAEELTKLLGVEVQVMQPFVNIDVSKVNVPLNLNVDGCRFGLAVGLSLRGLL
ncbi:MAG: type IV pilus assembly protein PilM [Candidatus Shapirobacteria bacterium]|nr:type IV pilus assembly protein PilM [Candidatus Shapirobacteria bacterium]